MPGGQPVIGGGVGMVSNMMIDQSQLASGSPSMHQQQQHIPYGSNMQQQQNPWSINNNGPQQQFHQQHHIHQQQQNMNLRIQHQNMPQPQPQQHMPPPQQNVMMQQSQQHQGHMAGQMSTQPQALPRHHNHHMYQQPQTGPGQVQHQFQVGGSPAPVQSHVLTGVPTQVSQHHHQNHPQQQSHYHHAQHQQQLQQPLPQQPQTPLPPPQQPQQPPNHNPLNLPLGLQPEYKIFEMNKRLAYMPDFNEFNDFNKISMWWDGFVNEFFDDTSRLTIRNVIDENGPKNYTISRTLIPRFFRSLNEGGVTELYFHLGRCHTNITKDVPTQGQSILTLEADMCTMNTKHGRPMFAKISTEGHLTVELLLNNPDHPSFASNDPHHLNHPSPLRIKNWIFTIKRHQELIPRSAIAIQHDPNLIDQLSKNITKTGIVPSTLHYLKLCSVLEPMQELMVKNRMSGMPPRECLRSSVAQKTNIRMSSNDSSMNVAQGTTFQRTNSIGDDIKAEILPGGKTNNQTGLQAAADPRTPNKRRKRKPSGSNTPNTNEIKKEPGSASKSKKATAAAAAAAAVAASAQAQVQQQQMHNQHHHHHHQNMMNINSSSDVMVVGEPSLMGGDFGEEDERLITRLENNQYDAMSASANHLSMQHQQHQQQMQMKQQQQLLQQQQQQQINLLRNNSFQHPQQQQQMPSQLINQLIDDSNQQSQLNELQQGPPRPPSSLSLPPRPQSNLNIASLLVNNPPSNQLVLEQPPGGVLNTRASTPSPTSVSALSSSNIIMNVHTPRSAAVQTPGPNTTTTSPPPPISISSTQQLNQTTATTPTGNNGNISVQRPSPSLTPSIQNGVQQSSPTSMSNNLNLNGVNMSPPSLSTNSMPQPPNNNNINNMNGNLNLNSQQQQQQQPSTSSSSTASSSSSSSSSSPNSIFSSIHQNNQSINTNNNNNNNIPVNSANPSNSSSFQLSSNSSPPQLNSNGNTNKTLSNEQQQQQQQQSQKSMFLTNF